MSNNPPAEPLPRFIIGDDCQDAIHGRLFVAHLHNPPFVLRVEHSAEQGVNVFHPTFLGDSSRLSPVEKQKLIREAAAFYAAAWRRAIAPLATG